jgi:phosphoglycerate dehydrogenase-like enzyme
MKSSNDGFKGIILVAQSIHQIEMFDSSRQGADDLETLLRKTADGREFCITEDKTEVEKILDRIEIAFGDIPFELIPKMPNLKWLQLWSAGADLLQTYPEFKALPFKMTTTSGIHLQQIAEHVFALILTWNRKMWKVFAAQKERRWARPSMHEMEVLSGKTMLILGYGAIGEKIAAVAQCFGMEVTGVRRSVSTVSVDAKGVTVVPAARLLEYLPQADYIVNILPYTPDTCHFFGGRELAALKNSAVYVNVGRGGTTDEAALAEALRDKRLAAALLDVTETEPLSEDSPLWDMDNVLLTPHYAGFHPEYNRLAMEIAIENLGHYVRGEPLRNLVDKNAGY